MAVDYDPLSEEAMTDPQSLYAQLRAEDPVHYMARYDAWALASFSAVWQVCSDTSSFSVQRGPTPNQILLGEPASDLTFAGLDPPQHRLRRRVLAPYYTRDSADRDDATIRTIARAVLDPLLATAGRFDAYADYAHVVAGRFAATKAGVPLGDADHLREQIAASFHREQGQRGTSAVNVAATIEVFTYLQSLVVECRRDRERATGVLGPLLDAVVDGALLRLRPKVMTVSTVVAGLLPIMWSTGAGAEVMRPLATPVLGGMVSSLLHVLIVTPVIFYWIQLYRLRREEKVAE